MKGGGEKRAIEETTKEKESEEEREIHHLLLGQKTECLTEIERARISGADHFAVRGGLASS